MIRSYPASRLYAVQIARNIARARCRPTLGREYVEGQLGATWTGVLWRWDTWDAPAPRPASEPRRMSQLAAELVAQHVNFAVEHGTGLLILMPEAATW